MVIEAASVQSNTWAGVGCLVSLGVGSQPWQTQGPEDLTCAEGLNSLSLGWSH